MLSGSCVRWEWAGGKFCRALVLHSPASSLSAGHQGSFCMLCVMQNHIVQAFANSGNAIKPVSFIRDLKSKSVLLTQAVLPPVAGARPLVGEEDESGMVSREP